MLLEEGGHREGLCAESEDAGFDRQLDVNAACAASQRGRKGRQSHALLAEGSSRRTWQPAR